MQSVLTPRRALDNDVHIFVLPVEVASPVLPTIIAIATMIAPQLFVVVSSYIYHVVDNSLQQAEGRACRPLDGCRIWMTALLSSHHSLTLHHALTTVHLLFTCVGPIFC